MDVKRRVRQVLLLGFAIALAIFSASGSAVAESAGPDADTWCPPCSSDFCQSGGGEYLYWVGGSCYCCVELDSQEPEESRD